MSQKIQKPLQTQGVSIGEKIQLNNLDYKSTTAMTPLWTFFVYTV